MVLAIPIDLFFAVAQLCIQYWVLGLNYHIENFVKCIIVIILLTSTGNVVGVIMGIVAPTLEAATSADLPVLIPFIM